MPLLIYSEVQPSWFPNVMTRRKIRRVAVDKKLPLQSNENAPVI